ncbi:nuclear transport factor 2 family protein [Geodermatophilus nigrescens]
MDNGNTETATGIRDAVLANYAAQCQAMVAGDADALGALLAEDFTLVHMTGYRQPKAEWLADVRSGAMTYHSMQDVAVSVDVPGDAPVVTARTHTAATIWGATGTWPLQLRITFAQHGTAWVAAGTVASTWR